MMQLCAISVLGALVSVSGVSTNCGCPLDWKRLTAVSAKYSEDTDRDLLRFEIRTEWLVEAAPEESDLDNCVKYLNPVVLGSAEIRFDKEVSYLGVRIKKNTDLLGDKYDIFEKYGNYGISHVSGIAPKHGYGTIFRTEAFDFPVGENVVTFAWTDVDGKVFEASVCFNEPGENYDGVYSACTR